MPARLHLCFKLASSFDIGVHLPDRGLSCRMDFPVPTAAYLSCMVHVSGHNVSECSSQIRDQLTHILPASVANLTDLGAGRPWLYPERMRLQTFAMAKNSNHVKGSHRPACLLPTSDAPLLVYYQSAKLAASCAVHSLLCRWQGVARRKSDYRGFTSGLPAFGLCQLRPVRSAVDKRSS